MKVKILIFVFIFLFTCTFSYSEQIYTFKSSSEILTVDFIDNQLFLFLDSGTLWIIDLENKTPSIIDIGGPVFFPMFKNGDSLFFVTSPGSIIKGSELHQYQHTDITLNELYLPDNSIKKKEIGLKNIFQFEMHFPFFYLASERKFVVFDYNKKTEFQNFIYPTGALISDNELLILYRENDAQGMFRIMTVNFKSFPDINILDFKLKNAEVIRFDSQLKIMSSENSYKLFNEKKKIFEDLKIPVPEYEFIGSKNDFLVFSNKNNFLLKSSKTKIIIEKNKFENLDLTSRINILITNNDYFSFYSYNENFFQLYVYNITSEKLIYKEEFLISSITNPKVWFYSFDNDIFIIQEDTLKSLNLNGEEFEISNEKIIWGITQVKFINNYAIISDNKNIFVFSLNTN